jgi:hypothetical protein
MALNRLITTSGMPNGSTCVGAANVVRDLVRARHAQHGRGEVDAVGGLTARGASRREAAAQPH